jgi:hypothetical protein
MNAKGFPGFFVAVLLQLVSMGCALAQDWTLVRVRVEDDQVLDPDGSGWLFTALASSADGFRMVGVGGGNLSGAPVCVSRDGGLTWQATSAPLLYWLAVASSASGAQLAASGEGSTTAPDGAGVYVSADAGVTWKRSATFIGAIACSADGKHLVVVKSPEYQGSPNPSSIYISSDAGASWSAASEPASTNRWTAVACSADGMRLVAVGTTYDKRMTDLFLSSDGGFSWLPVGLPQVSWQRVASSADGKRLVAVSAYPSSLYTSADSGASWTPQPGATAIELGS